MQTLLSRWLGRSGKNQPKRRLNGRRGKPLGLEPLEQRALLSLSLNVIDPVDDLPETKTQLVALDGLETDDPNSVVDYTVSSDNANVTAQLLTGGESLVLTVSGADDGSGNPFSGDISIWLLPDSAPTAVARIKQLVNDGQLTGTDFFRIADLTGNGGLIAQGGPQNTGLGDFDDEYDPDYTFTSGGLLAMANAGDDTNDGQFFFVRHGLELNQMPEHLNFQHPIWGIVTEGNDILENIFNTPRSGSTPDDAPEITAAAIVDNVQDGVLAISAPAGAAGESATITVTADSAESDPVVQTFQIDVVEDSRNDPAFIGQFDTTLEVNEDDSLTIVLDGYDLEGDDLDWLIRDANNTSQDPPNVTVDIQPGSGSATVTFTPDADFVGDIEMIAALGDGVNNYDTQLFTLTVNPVNEAPIANDLDALSVTEGETLPIQLTGDDGDANKEQTLTFEIVDQPDDGGIQNFNPQTGALEYVAPQGFTGLVTFTYLVRDDGGTDNGGDDTSETATVTINVTEQVDEGLPDLTGVKYEDLTGDGFSQDDTPLGGVVIELYADNGDAAFDPDTDTLQATAVTTAGTGAYSFDNLSDGRYFIREVTPTGATQTDGPAYYTVIVADGNIYTGQAQLVDDFASPDPQQVWLIAAEDDDPTHLEADGSMLGGERDVLIDVQGQSQLITTNGGIGTDNGDTVLLFGSAQPGTLLTLQYDGDDTDTAGPPAALVNSNGLSADLTASNGTAFRFDFDFMQFGGPQTNIGTQIRLVGPGGTATYDGDIPESDGPFHFYVPFSDFTTTGTFSFGDVTSIEIDINTGAIPTVDYQLDNIIIAAGEESFDFANYFEPVDIGGVKYEDLTGDGFSGDDVPRAGVTIQLYADNGDGLFDPATDTLQDTAVTAANTGAYTFEDLTSGRYFIREIVPTGSIQTDGPNYYVVDVVGGQIFTGDAQVVDDFSSPNPAQVWEISGANPDPTHLEADGSMLGGERDVLVDVLGSPMLISSNGSIGSDNGDSVLLFGSGQPGTLLTLQFDGDDTDTAGPPAALVNSDGLSADLTASNGTAFRFDFDFMQFGNGANESVGVEIRLVGPGGTATFNGQIPEHDTSFDFHALFDDFTTTGTFSFDNVTSIEIDLNAEGIPAVDYQLDNIVIAAGDRSLDFANYTPRSSISGYVYVDIDNDGIKDASESVIANVPIRLIGTDDLGNPVDLSTTTNFSGYYEFTELRPGTYSIIETQPAAFVDGKDTIGTPGGVTSNDEFSQIDLPPDFDGVNNNFGELHLVPELVSKRTLLLPAVPDDIFDADTGQVLDAQTGDPIDPAAPENVGVEFNVVPTSAGIDVQGTAGNDIFEVTLGKTPSETVVVLNGATIGNLDSLSDLRLDGGGGNDLLVVYGTDGNETVSLGDDYGQVIGQGSVITSSNMERHTVVGGGGNDQATLHDSAGADVLQARDTITTFSGEDFLQTLYGFDNIRAISNSGDDVAELYHTAGGSTFIGRSDGATLSGKGFSVQADGFARIFSSAFNDDADEHIDADEAVAGAGGINVAKLYDSFADDMLEADDNWARIQYAASMIMLSDYDEVTAYSSEGGNDKKRIAADLLFTMLTDGTWTDV